MLNSPFSFGRHYGSSWVRKLQFSSAYHPQIDGQIKVVNWSLGNLLRCLVGERVKSWDSMLPTTKFAYNGSINRSIGLSPFEAVLGYKPRMPADLLPISSLHRPSASIESFAHHIHALHTRLKRELTWVMSLTNYLIMHITDLWNSKLAIMNDSHRDRQEVTSS